jgi:hypothetical protein
MASFQDARSSGDSCNEGLGCTISKAGNKNSRNQKLASGINFAAPQMFKKVHQIF